MEAMVASGSRLCQTIQGAGLRPRTAQRFQTVLATAGIVALADAGFASRMDDMMVNSIRKFAAVKKRVAKAPCDTQVFIWIFQKILFDLR